MLRSRKAHRSSSRFSVGALITFATASKNTPHQGKADPTRALDIFNPNPENLDNLLEEPTLGSMRNIITGSVLVKECRDIPQSMQVPVAQHPKELVRFTFF